MINGIGEEIGVYFGYPPCCIKSFMDAKRKITVKTPDQVNPKVHKYHGFIPCPTHAKMIAEGDITIESLISNRICSREYPDDGEMAELDDYLASANV